MQSTLPNDGLNLYNVTLYCGLIEEWSTSVDSNDEIRVWDDDAHTDGIMCNGCAYNSAAETVAAYNDAPSAYLSTEAIDEMGTAMDNEIDSVIYAPVNAETVGHRFVDIRTYDDAEAYLTRNPTSAKHYHTFVASYLTDGSGIDEATAARLTLILAAASDDVYAGCIANAQSVLS
jgi:hypothetical protein